ncbi:electron transport complex subunit RsxC [Salinispirillum sp. LH 10-3-1]|uniref:Ion-translocating oxidoreductase complex subunit C n=1 Tax=Salinispirillum sp. LH 10-3-1 TaxID=2952525 RepID=A0AB38YDC0_9GAMM
MWGFTRAGKPRKNGEGQTYWTLPGSVHPPENKTQSLVNAIQAMPLVREYVVPLNQHIGAFALPCVDVGQHVLKGELIAEAAGFISAPAHAPTSGEVIAIEERQVPHASGLTTSCIIIRADGKDQWRPREPWDDLQSHRVADILARVQRSGVTGLGGASFPTAVKLSSDRDHIDTLIVNGTECEPYITADHSLMRERAAAVYAGINVVDHLYHFNRILVAIEDNKPDAIVAMRQAIPDHLKERVEVRTFPTRYPSGGEKQLIYILTGREVPSGGLPLDIGMLCHNVGTLAALSDAVFHDEPLLRRITTVTGEAVARPGNYDTLIGTPMRELCRVAGVNTDKADRVIMGGPMMGFALPHTDLPVVKATNCLLIPTGTELPLPGVAQPCIRCGLCEQACPASLLPQQLMWFAQAKELDKAEDHRLFDCIECGACAYVCPSNIPLVQYYRAAKGQIRQEQAEHKQAERARVRFEARQARLDREAAEKEAKRQERAAAAARANAAKLAAAASDSTDVSDAVERAKSKHPDKPTAATPPALTTEQLTAKLSNLTGRVAKAESKLAEARADAPEQVKALETTVNKLQEQIKKVQADLARAEEQN